MIRFILDKNALYDCVLKITDIYGTREHFVPMVDTEKSDKTYLDVEVYSEDFEITLTPVQPDYKKLVKEAEAESENPSFFDKMIFRFLGKMLSGVEKYFLLVESKYKATGVADESVIEVKSRQYECETFLTKIKILDFLAVSYVFFEPLYGTNVLELMQTKPTNRTDVIKFFKKLAFAQGFISGIVQTQFARKNTKDETVFQKLHSFNTLPEEQRQEIIKRNEDLMSCEEEHS